MRATNEPLVRGRRHVTHCRCGGELYLWIWYPHQRTEVLRSIGRMAADPELRFGWHDAAVLSMRVRRVRG
jgi:hypothetical protein